MDIKILVAAHKPYQMPEDSMYLPIQVGAAGRASLGFQRDDEGENISPDNLRFCELTAIYWAWKNLTADYIGLAHYRRHFTTQNLWNRRGEDKFSYVLTQNELEPILHDYDVIVPQKRCYYIENIRSHYNHLPYTYEKDIEKLGQIIQRIEPDYNDAYEIVMHRSWAHMFNMFIMKEEVFKQYCEWMFPILFEADKEIDVSDYTPMEARAVAYFGEFMLDVWLEKNPQKIKEIDVMFMEKQNWVLKGGKFIMRKMIRGGVEEHNLIALVFKVLDYTYVIPCGGVA